MLLCILYSGVNYFTYLNNTDNKIGIYTFVLNLFIINIKNIDVFPLITFLFLISVLFFLALSSSGLRTLPFHAITQVRIL